MGGKALKKCITKRMTKVEYDIQRAVILSTLRQDFPGRRIEGLESYRQKQSFGDIDFLIEKDGLTVDLRDYVKTRFGTQEIFHNGDLFSFEYKQNQIDLILTPANRFDFSRDFQAYNDLGNLVRRIAHLMGLRLGTTGLVYKWLDGEQLVDTICVTRSWATTLETLGYSSERWAEGFDTLEDIFEFVTTSPYFHPDLYLAEAHTRDARREVYQQFLIWLAAKPAAWGPYAKPLPESWLPVLFERFPKFKSKYEAIQVSVDKARAAKQFFNATLVSQWTGKVHRELGEVMARFRAQFKTPDAMRDWILSSDQHTIEAFVKDLAGQNK